MVAEQVRDYLENGNIRNAVNLPEAVMPRGEGTRLATVHANVPEYAWSTIDNTCASELEHHRHVEQVARVTCVHTR